MRALLVCVLSCTALPTEKEGPQGAQGQHSLAAPSGPRVDQPSVSLLNALSNAQKPPWQTKAKKASSKANTCRDNPRFADVRTVTDAATGDIVVPYTCDSWEGFLCDSKTADRCNITAEKLTHTKQACPETCGLCPTSIGNDPIFRYAGKWFKVLLPPGSDMPLLSWKGAQGHKFELSGTTFSSKKKPSAQWFDRFHLKVEGGGSLDVQRTALHDGHKPSPGLHTMKIMLDGKPLQNTDIKTFSAGMSQGKEHKGLWAINENGQDSKWLDTVGLSVSVHTSGKTIGSEHSEHMTVSSGGVRFEIFTQAASKYSKEAAQERYSHVNLKLPTIPWDATGFIAELAGQQPLSAKTKAYLLPAKHSQSAGRARWASWDAKSMSLTAGTSVNPTDDDVFRPEGPPDDCPGVFQYPTPTPTPVPPTPTPTPKPTPVPKPICAQSCDRLSALHAITGDDDQKAEVCLDSPVYDHDDVVREWFYRSKVGFLGDDVQSCATAKELGFCSVPNNVDNHGNNHTYTVYGRMENERHNILVRYACPVTCELLISSAEYCVDQDVIGRALVLLWDASSDTMLDDCATTRKLYPDVCDEWTGPFGLICAETCGTQEPECVDACSHPPAAK